MLVCSEELLQVLTAEFKRELARLRAQRKRSGKPLLNQDITVPKPSVTILREGRMVGD